MKIKKLPKLNLRLDFSEKFNSNKQVIMRTQEEIDSYKKAIGYIKARVKRYGKIPAKKAR